MPEQFDPLNPLFSNGNTLTPSASSAASMPTMEPEDPGPIDAASLAQQVMAGSQLPAVDPDGTQDIVRSALAAVSSHGQTAPFVNPDGSSLTPFQQQVVNWAEAAPSAQAFPYARPGFLNVDYDPSGKMAVKRGDTFDTVSAANVFGRQFTAEDLQKDDEGRKLLALMKQARTGERPGFFSGISKFSWSDIPFFGWMTDLGTSAGEAIDISKAMRKLQNGDPVTNHEAIAVRRFLTQQELASNQSIAYNVGSVVHQSVPFAVEMAAAGAMIAGTTKVGSIVGGAVGSVLPGAGTAVGAGVGATIGAAVGGILFGGRLITKGVEKVASWFGRKAVTTAAEKLTAKAAGEYLPGAMTRGAMKFAPYTMVQGDAVNLVDSSFRQGLLKLVTGNLPASEAGKLGRAEIYAGLKKLGPDGLKKFKDDFATGVAGTAFSKADGAEGVIKSSMERVVKVPGDLTLSQKYVKSVTDVILDNSLKSFELQYADRGFVNGFQRFGRWFGNHAMNGMYRWDVSAFGGSAGTIVRDGSAFATKMGTLKEGLGVALVEAPMRGAMQLAVQAPLWPVVSMATGHGPNDFVLRGTLGVQATALESGDRTLMDHARAVGLGMTAMEYISENAGRGIDLVATGAIKPAFTALLPAQTKQFGNWMSKRIEAMFGPAEMLLPKNQARLADAVATQIGRTAAEKGIQKSVSPIAKNEVLAMVQNPSNVSAGLKSFMDASGMTPKTLIRQAIATEAGNAKMRFAGVYALGYEMLRKGWTPQKVHGIFNKIGYDGIIAEMAEERYGDFFDGLFGWNDRPSYAGFTDNLKQAWGGLFPDKDQLITEALGFAFPAVTQMTLIGLQKHLGQGPLQESVDASNYLAHLSHQGYDALLNLPTLDADTRQKIADWKVRVDAERDKVLGDERSNFARAASNAKSLLDDAKSGKFDAAIKAAGIDLSAEPAAPAAQEPGASDKEPGSAEKPATEEAPAGENGGKKIIAADQAIQNAGSLRVLRGAQDVGQMQKHLTDLAASIVDGSDTEEELNTALNGVNGKYVFGEDGVDAIRREWRRRTGHSFADTNDPIEAALGKDSAFGKLASAITDKDGKPVEITVGPADAASILDGTLALRVAGQNNSSTGSIEDRAAGKGSPSAQFSLINDDVHEQTVAALSRLAESAYRVRHNISKDMSFGRRALMKFVGVIDAFTTGNFALAARNPVEWAMEDSGIPRGLMDLSEKIYAESLVHGRQAVIDATDDAAEKAALNSDKDDAKKDIGDSPRVEDFAKAGHEYFVRQMSDLADTYLAAKGVLSFSRSDLDASARRYVARRHQFADPSKGFMLPDGTAVRSVDDARFSSAYAKEIDGVKGKLVDTLARITVTGAIARSSHDEAGLYDAAVALDLVRAQKYGTDPEIIAAISEMPAFRQAAKILDISAMSEEFSSAVDGGLFGRDIEPAEIMAIDTDTRKMTDKELSTVVHAMGRDYGEFSEPENREAATRFVRRVQSLIRSAGATSFTDSTGAGRVVSFVRLASGKVSASYGASGSLKSAVFGTMDEMTAALRAEGFEPSYRRILLTNSRTVVSHDALSLSLFLMGGTGSETARDHAREMFRARLFESVGRDDAGRPVVVSEREDAYPPILRKNADGSYKYDFSDRGREDAARDTVAEMRDPGSAAASKEGRTGYLAASETILRSSFGVKERVPFDSGSSRFGLGDVWCYRMDSLSTPDTLYVSSDYASDGDGEGLLRAELQASLRTAMRASAHDARVCRLAVVAFHRAAKELLSDGSVLTDEQKRRVRLAVDNLRLSEDGVVTPYQVSAVASSLLMFTCERGVNDRGNGFLTSPELALIADRMRSDGEEQGWRSAVIPFFLSTVDRALGGNGLFGQAPMAADRGILRLAGLYAPDAATLAMSRASALFAANNQPGSTPASKPMPVLVRLGIRAGTTKDALADGGGASVSASPVADLGAGVPGYISAMAASAAKMAADYKAFGGGVLTDEQAFAMVAKATRSDFLGGVSDASASAPSSGGKLSIGTAVKSALRSRGQAVATSSFSRMGLEEASTVAKTLVDILVPDVSMMSRDAQDAAIKASADEALGYLRSVLSPDEAALVVTQFTAFAKLGKTGAAAALAKARAAADRAAAAAEAAASTIDPDATDLTGQQDADDAADEGAKDEFDERQRANAVLNNSDLIEFGRTARFLFPVEGNNYSAVLHRFRTDLHRTVASLDSGSHEKSVLLNLERTFDVFSVPRGEDGVSGVLSDSEAFLDTGKVGRLDFGLAVDALRRLHRYDDAYVLASLAGIPAAGGHLVKALRLVGQMSPVDGVQLDADAGSSGKFRTSARRARNIVSLAAVRAAVVQPFSCGKFKYGPDGKPVGDVLKALESVAQLFGGRAGTVGRLEAIRASMSLYGVDETSLGNFFAAFDRARAGKNDGIEVKTAKGREIVSMLPSAYAKIVRGLLARLEAAKAGGELVPSADEHAAVVELAKIVAARRAALADMVDAVIGPVNQVSAALRDPAAVAAYVSGAERSAYGLTSLLDDANRYMTYGAGDRVLPHARPSSRFLAAVFGGTFDAVAVSAQRAALKQGRGTTWNDAVEAADRPEVLSRLSRTDIPVSSDLPAETSGYAVTASHESSLVQLLAVYASGEPRSVDALTGTRSAGGVQSRDHVTLVPSSPIPGLLRIEDSVLARLDVPGGSTALKELLAGHGRYADGTLAVVAVVGARRGNVLEDRRALAEDSVQSMRDDFAVRGDSRVLRFPLYHGDKNNVLAVQLPGYVADAWFQAILSRHEGVTFAGMNDKFRDVISALNGKSLLRIGDEKLRASAYDLLYSSVSAAAGYDRLDAKRVQPVLTQGVITSTHHGDSFLTDDGRVVVPGLFVTTSVGGRSAASMHGGWMIHGFNAEASRRMLSADEAGSLKSHLYSLRDVGFYKGQGSDFGLGTGLAGDEESSIDVIRENQRRMRRSVESALGMRAGILDAVDDPAKAAEHAKAADQARRFLETSTFVASDFDTPKAGVFGSRAGVALPADAKKGDSVLVGGKPVMTFDGKSWAPSAELAKAAPWFTAAPEVKSGVPLAWALSAYTAMTGKDLSAEDAGKLEGDWLLDDGTVSHDLLSASGLFHGYGTPKGESVSFTVDTAANGEKSVAMRFFSRNYATQTVANSSSPSKMTYEHSLSQSERRDMTILESWYEDDRSRLVFPKLDAAWRAINGALVDAHPELYDGVLRRDRSLVSLLSRFPFDPAARAAYSRKVNAFYASALETPTYSSHGVLVPSGGVVDHYDERAHTATVDWAPGTTQYTKDCFRPARVLTTAEKASCGTSRTWGSGAVNVQDKSFRYGWYLDEEKFAAFEKSHPRTSPAAAGSVVHGSDAALAERVEAAISGARPRGKSADAAYREALFSCFTDYTGRSVAESLKLQDKLGTVSVDDLFLPDGTFDHAAVEAGTRRRMSRGEEGKPCLYVGGSIFSADRRPSGNFEAAVGMNRAACPVTFDPATGAAGKEAMYILDPVTVHTQGTDYDGDSASVMTFSGDGRGVDMSLVDRVLALVPKSGEARVDHMAIAAALEGTRYSLGADGRVPDALARDFANSVFAVQVANYRKGECRHQYPLAYEGVDSADGAAIADSLGGKDLVDVGFAGRKPVDTNLLSAQLPLTSDGERSVAVYRSIMGADAKVDGLSFEKAFENIVDKLGGKPKNDIVSPDGAAKVSAAGIDGADARATAVFHQAAYGYVFAHAKHDPMLRNELAAFMVRPDGYDPARDFISHVDGVSNNLFDVMKKLFAKRAGWTHGMLGRYMARLLVGGEADFNANPGVRFDDAWFFRQTAGYLRDFYANKPGDASFDGLLARLTDDNDPKAAEAAVRELVSHAGAAATPAFVSAAREFLAGNRGLTKQEFIGKFMHDVVDSGFLLKDMADGFADGDTGVAFENAVSRRGGLHDVDRFAFLVRAAELGKDAVVDGVAHMSAVADAYASAPMITDLDAALEPVKAIRGDPGRFLAAAGHMPGTAAEDDLKEYPVTGGNSMVFDNFMTAVARVREMARRAGGPESDAAALAPVPRWLSSLPGASRRAIDARVPRIVAALGAVEPVDAQSVTVVAASAMDGRVPASAGNVAANLRDLPYVAGALELCQGDRTASAVLAAETESRSGAADALRSEKDPAKASALARSLASSDGIRSVVDRVINEHFRAAVDSGSVFGSRNVASLFAMLRTGSRGSRLAEKASAVDAASARLGMSELLASDEVVDRESGLTRSGFARLLVLDSALDGNITPVDDSRTSTNFAAAVPEDVLREMGRTGLAAERLPAVRLLAAVSARRNGRIDLFTRSGTPSDKSRAAVSAIVRTVADDTGAKPPSLAPITGHFILLSALQSKRFASIRSGVPVPEIVRGTGGRTVRYADAPVAFSELSSGPAAATRDAATPAPAAQPYHLEGSTGAGSTLFESDGAKYATVEDAVNTWMDHRVDEMADAGDGVDADPAALRAYFLSPGGQGDAYREIRRIVTDAARTSPDFAAALAKADGRWISAREDADSPAARGEDLVGQALTEAARRGDFAGGETAEKLSVDRPPVPSVEGSGTMRRGDFFDHLRRIHGEKRLEEFSGTPRENIEAAFQGAFGEWKTDKDGKPVSGVRVTRVVRNGKPVDLLKVERVFRSKDGTRVVTTYISYGDSIEGNPSSAEYAQSLLESVRTEFGKDAMSEKDMAALSARERQLLARALNRRVLGSSSSKKDLGIDTKGLLLMSGMIRLSSDASYRTLFHEYFHQMLGFFRGSGVCTEADDKALAAQYHRIDGTFDEEAAADAFADTLTGKSGVASPIGVKQTAREIFSRFHDVVTSLLNGLRRRTADGKETFMNALLTADVSDHELAAAGEKTDAELAAVEDLLLGKESEFTMDSQYVSIEDDAGTKAQDLLDASSRISGRLANRKALAENESGEAWLAGMKDDLRRADEAYKAHPTFPGTIDPQAPAAAPKTGAAESVTVSPAERYRAEKTASGKLQLFFKDALEKYRSEDPSEAADVAEMVRDPKGPTGVLAAVAVARRLAALAATHLGLTGADAASAVGDARVQELALRLVHRAEAERASVPAVTGLPSHVTARLWRHDNGGTHYGYSPDIETATHASAEYTFARALVAVEPKGWRPACHALAEQSAELFTRAQDAFTKRAAAEGDPALKHRYGIAAEECGKRAKDVARLVEAVLNGTRAGDLGGSGDPVGHAILYVTDGARPVPDADGFFHFVPGLAKDAGGNRTVPTSMDGLSDNETILNGAFLQDAMSRGANALTIAAAAHKYAAENGTDLQPRGTEEPQGNPPGTPEAAVPENGTMEPDMAPQWILQDAHMWVGADRMKNFYGAQLREIMSDHVLEAAAEQSNSTATMFDIVFGGNLAAGDKAYHLEFKGSNVAFMADGTDAWSEKNAHTVLSAAAVRGYLGGMITRGVKRDGEAFTADDCDEADFARQAIRTLAGHGLNLYTGIDIRPLLAGTLRELHDAAGNPKTFEQLAGAEGHYRADLVIDRVTSSKIDKHVGPDGHPTGQPSNLDIVLHRVLTSVPASILKADKPDGLYARILAAAAAADEKEGGEFALRDALVKAGLAKTSSASGVTVLVVPVGEIDAWWRTTGAYRKLAATRPAGLLEIGYWARRFAGEGNRLHNIARQSKFMSRSVGGQLSSAGSVGLWFDPGTGHHALNVRHFEAAQTMFAGAPSTDEVLASKHAELFEVLSRHANRYRRGEKAPSGPAARGRNLADAAFPAGGSPRVSEHQIENLMKHLGLGGHGEKTAEFIAGVSAGYYEDPRSNPAGISVPRGLTVAQFDRMISDFWTAELVAAEDGRTSVLSGLGHQDLVDMRSIIERLADAVAAEKPFAEDRLVAMSEDEAFDRLGVLPSAATASEALRSMAESVVHAERFRSCLSQMLLTVSADGTPNYVVSPTEGGEAALPDAYWAAAARFVIDRYRGAGARMPGYDAALSGVENMRRVYRAVSFAEAEAVKGLDAKGKKPAAESPRVRPNYHSLDPTKLSAMPLFDGLLCRLDTATESGSSSVLDLAQGGEAAGYMKQLLGQLRQPSVSAGWRAVDRLLSYSKAASVSMSAFFAFATRFESPIAATGFWHTALGLMPGNAGAKFGRWAGKSRTVRRLMDWHGEDSGVGGFDSDAVFLSDIMRTMTSDDSYNVEMRELCDLIGMPLSEAQSNPMSDRQSTINADIKRIGQTLRNQGRGGLARRVENGLRFALSNPTEYAFSNVLNGVKMAVVSQTMRRLREECEASGRPFDPVRELRKYSDYLNAEIGGIDPARYAWLTPQMQRILRFFMFSWQWTMGAWNAGGGEAISDVLFGGHHTTAVSRRWAMVRWARMIGIVSVGVPVFMQVATKLLAKAIKGQNPPPDQPDPDDMPWLCFENESKIGALSFDVTPLLEANGKIPGAKALKKAGIPFISALVPAYVGGGANTTGRRRYYMHFGKQNNEFFRWFTDPWSQAMSKMSLPLQKTLEGLFGSTSGSAFAKKFADKGLADRIFSLSRDPDESALANWFTAYLPFSCASIAGHPDAGVLGMMAPVSMGTALSATQKALAERLTRFAEDERHSDPWAYPGNRRQLNLLCMDILREAKRNGVDPKEVLSSAMGVASHREYTRLFASLPRDIETNNFDAEKAASSVRALTRLNKRRGIILESLAKQYSRAGMDWKKQRPELRAAAKRFISGIRSSPYGFGKDDAEAIVETLRSQMNDAKLRATGVQQDAKGGVAFRNFLATDRVPDTLFGIPVVSDAKDLTDEDREFFRMNPKAAGYYDMGESLPPRKRPQGVPEEEPEESEEPEEANEEGEENAQDNH